MLNQSSNSQILSPEAAPPGLLDIADPAALLAILSRPDFDPGAFDIDMEPFLPSSS